ncbi:hypothetical protein QFZ77_007347 [Paenibacillus sp. V4I3]|nr:hypothetical protein [Paenibacillus sp. V4I3]MDQ0885455.1 hypothetical protein [Paenibacillus sp. V4I9]
MMMCKGKRRVESQTYQIDFSRKVESVLGFGIFFELNHMGVGTDERFCWIYI